ncbi:phage tail protein [Corallococcus sp. 4LFB]|uniref:phage tail protein n=1 Tax=Corallococcus sp. 4LFB TaxID=3383249 RepID=UPI0039766388
MTDPTTMPTAIDPDDFVPVTVPASLKHRLLAKNRKVLKTLDIDGDKVHVVKPTQGDRVKVLEAAREAGEMGDDDKPTTPRNALRMVARIAVCLLYEPATGTPIYSTSDLDALTDAVWLEDVQEEIQNAFAPNMKDVRGKSEATPS